VEETELAFLKETISDDTVRERATSEGSRATPESTAFTSNARRSDETLSAMALHQFSQPVIEISFEYQIMLSLQPPPPKQSGLSIPEPLITCAAIAALSSHPITTPTHAH
jgi:hypothetical protein